MGCEIRAMLLSVGTDMWNEKDKPKTARFDETVWTKYIDAMVEGGYNLVLLDLGEGVVYPSHPELAIPGSWTPEETRAKVAYLKSRGIEAIPKLNFSATHDNWLGEYSRMIATPTYYGVVEDLIRDASELFGRPRFLHIGMDEENAHWQRKLSYVVMRQGDLWWHDCRFIAECVRRQGVRPWMWSDRIWHHKDEFLKNCPKDILQTNAVYGPDICTHRPLREGYECNMWDAFEVLDKAGFDQVACGSNWECDGNMAQVVKCVKDEVKSDRMKGFLQSSWYYTLPDNDKTKHETRTLNAIRLGAKAFCA